MEIVSGRFSAAFRLAVCLAFAAGCWVMVASWVWEGNLQSLSPPLLVGGGAIIATLAAWTYGTRTYRAFRRRPYFTLSKVGITIGKRLLPWKELATLEYRYRNMRGYRSHTCHITRHDGGALSLDLDTVSLGPARVMLLIDFYASGARLP